MENTNSGNGKIIIVGDLFPVPSNFDLFSKGDIQTLFGQKICDLFASADYRICNLEGALTDGTERCEKTGPAYIAPTSTVKAFKELSIDCCTLANNHITDGGHSGVLDTMRTLDGYGIQHLGAGENSNSIRKFHVFEVGNHKIGLYNVAETMYNAPAETKAGAHLYDEYLVCKDIESFKKACDYLIVIYHGGIEQYRYPSPEIKKRFHRMADSGANMVLSQHTHCIGCEEYYNGSYLLYGQGNMLLFTLLKGLTDTGLILEIGFDDCGKASIKKHIVHSENGLTRYDDSQDFTDFDVRSAKVDDDGFLEAHFQEFCYSKLGQYIMAFKGKDHIGKLFRRFFPKRYKKEYFKKAYEKKQLLFTLHTLRSEQNRETAIEGIKFLLNQKN